MKRARKAKWMTFLLIAGIVLLGAIPALAQVTNVDTGETFATIQAAIDDSNTKNGNTITVDAGTYNEHVRITKSITLKGAQAGVDPRPSVGGRTGAETVLDAQEASAYVIQIAAANVTINGFTITGGTGDMVEESASADNLLFQHNILYDNLATAGDEAVQIKYSTGVTIEYNYAYNIVQDAFNLSSSSNGYVQYNEAHDIYSVNAGIYCYDATNISIIGNLLYNVPNNDGIKLGDSGDGSTGGSVSENTVYNCAEDGITVYASNVSVLNNLIHTCSSENGALYLYGADNSVVQGNVVRDSNAIGILIHNSTGVSVQNNRIYGNNDSDDTKYAGSAGIWITDSGSVSVLQGNEIRDNAFLNLKWNGTGSIDASGNWWGSDDPAVVAAFLDTSNVDFSPILTGGNDGDSTTAGWQPDMSSVTVHALGQQVGGTGRIQEGVNLVSAGGTVNVLAGAAAYIEQVTISKALTIQGSGNPVVQGNQNNQPTIRVAADGTVVSNLGITNTGNSGEIVGIFVGSASPAYSDVAGQSIQLNNNTIDGINTMSVGEGVCGIQAKSYDSGTGIDGLNILDNLITNVSQPTWGANGIMLQANVSNVLIQGNTISNIDGLWVYGIVLTPSNLETGFPTNVTIKNNVFEGLVGSLYPSVAIGVDSAISGHEPDASQATVRFNSLAGAAVGAANYDPKGILDAALNWWGSANGPTAYENADPIPEYAGGGSGAVGRIIFSPWIGIDPDGNPATPGVQITGPMLIIVAPVGPEPMGGYLNTAIAGANSTDLPYTDTIEVRGGSHVVSTSLTQDATVHFTGPTTMVSALGSASHPTLRGAVNIGSDGVLVGLPLQGFRINGNVTIGAGADAATSVINWCDLYGNMTNNGTGTFDAQYNYWGTLLESVVDARTTGAIDYEPFLPKNADDSYVDATAIINAGLASGIDPAIDQLWLMVQLGQDVNTFIGYAGVAGAGAFGGAPAGAEIILGGAAGGGGAVEGAISGTYTPGEPIDGRFTLTDPITGEPITDAAVTTSLLGPDGALVSWGCATYDETTGEYIFTIDTSGLAPGTYELIIQTDDGQSKTVSIEVQAA